MRVRSLIDKIRRQDVWYYLSEKFGLLDVGRLYGDSYYDRMHDSLEDETVVEDIRQFCSLIDERFEPETVLDLGCGIGHFLKPFHENGTYVYGVDGSQYAIETAVVPGEHLEVHDLREPYEAEREFDVVLCIEVLEHLPEESADTIVKTIASAGRTAVVSSAPPGQGGSYHLNEQPADYWIDKFQREGMEFRRELTASLRDEYSPKKMQYRDENLLVFERTDG